MTRATTSGSPKADETSPEIFAADTWLYHATKGARLFVAGEDQPGPGWFDAPVEPDAAAD